MFVYVWQYRKCRVRDRCFAMFYNLKFTIIIIDCSQVLVKHLLKVTITLSKCIACLIFVFLFVYVCHMSFLWWPSCQVRHVAFKNDCFLGLQYFLFANIFNYYYTPIYVLNQIQLYVLMKKWTTGTDAAAPECLLTGSFQI